MFVTLTLKRERYNNGDFGPWTATIDECVSITHKSVWKRYFAPMSPEEFESKFYDESVAVFRNVDLASIAKHIHSADVSCASAHLENALRALGVPCGYSRR